MIGMYDRVATRSTFQPLPAQEREAYWDRVSKQLTDMETLMCFVEGGPWELPRMQSQEPKIWRNPFWPNIDTRRKAA